MSNTQSIHGLMTGTAFILTIEGQAGVSGTVTNWGQTATEGLAVTVEVQRSRSMTAPEGVFFKVVDWTGFDTQKGDVDGYDARQMDLIHIWSFGDPGSTFQVPEKLLLEWRDANTARGHFVAHCYETPRDHDWSLTVIEPSTGRIATASGRITVADPDVTFAGMATAYVSQSGDFSDCPSSVPSPQRFTSINAAREYLYPRLPGGRIMLARGQDFAIGDSKPNQDGLSIGSGTLGALHIVAGPGSGTPPSVTVTTDDYEHMRIGTISQYYMGGEYVVSNIHHQGHWDQTTETGVQVGGYAVRSTGFRLFNRCTFDGLNPWAATPNDHDPVTGAYPSGSWTDAQKEENRRINHSNSSFMAHECLGENGDNYALFGNSIGKYAILGTQLAHFSNARSGGDFRPGSAPSNHSGAIRIEGDWPTDMFLDNTDLFSRFGWYRNLNEFRTIQPCFRYNTNSRPGFFLNVQRSSFEGGNAMLAVMRQNGSEPGSVSPLLLENCVFVTSFMTQTVVDLMGGNAAIRNNLIINTNRPSPTHDFSLRWVVKASRITGQWNVDPDLEFPEMYLSKLEVVGNTFIDLTDEVNRTNRDAVLVDIFSSTNPNPRGPVVEANNIIHKPNRDIPEIAFGPLDQTPIWQHREIYGAISSYSTAKAEYPIPFMRGDTIELPYPPGTTYANFIPQGQPNPKSRLLGRPYGGTIEHTPTGFNVTNNGTEVEDDIAAGETYTIELDRTFDPALYPQYASPPGSVWSGKPLAGSPAIGGADMAQPMSDRDIVGNVRGTPAWVGAWEEIG